MLIRLGKDTFRVEYEYHHESGYCSLDEIYMPGSDYNCIEWFSEDSIKWFEDLIVELFSKEM